MVIIPPPYPTGKKTENADAKSVRRSKLTVAALRPTLYLPRVRNFQSRDITPAFPCHLVPPTTPPPPPPIPALKKSGVQLPKGEYTYDTSHQPSHSKHHEEPPGWGMLGSKSTVEGSVAIQAAVVRWAKPGLVPWGWAAFGGMFELQTLQKYGIII